jgi:large subunit ribosomal protein L2
MFLKIYSPKNSSLRFRININKKDLNLKKFKKLFFFKKNNSGRNNSGKITVRHKGSGIFNLRRNIDIYRDYANNQNKFIGYDIDKKYSCFLGLIRYDNGCISYILAPYNLKLNQSVAHTYDSSKSVVGDIMLLG